MIMQVMPRIFSMLEIHQLIKVYGKKTKLQLKSLLFYKSLVLRPYVKYHLKYLNETRSTGLVHRGCCFNRKKWQFYRKRFFIFLFLMMASGKYLSEVAHGENMALIALAVLELSIAFALVLSSHCFWEK